jgi:hypothetical protein
MQDHERDPRRTPDIPGEELDTDRFRNLILRDLSGALDFDLGRILEGLRRRVPEFRVSVRRPDDLLIFDLIFENLKLIPGSNPRLVRSDPKATPTLVVEFPPQSFAEEAFLAVSNADADIGKEVTKEEEPPTEERAVLSGETVPPLPSSRVRMAGPSRLAFSMPKSETDLPFTLAAIFEAMRSWPMRLSTSALPDPRLGVAEQFFPTEITLGNFLSLVTQAPSWSLLRAGLSDALEKAGAEGIGEQIELAARRVAERAAAGLAAGSRSCLGVVLPEVFQGEIERLMRQFPSLQRGEVREAAIAAVSLGATELLAGSAQRIEIGLDEVDLVPFLPLLLAPHHPPANVTALELPYRLVTSPIESARWVHSDAAVEHGNRFELWHTRLTTSESDFGAEFPSKLRAIWSPDYPITEFNPLLAPKPKPFRMTLDPLDRKMLVRLMAGWNEKRGQRPYRPRAARADRLHLSSLGALLDAEGDWNPRPTGVDLEQWRHLASLGRDHYVRVVYAGYLCSYGHAASLVKVTERKFEWLDGNPSKRIAVLRQRFFIVCRQRVREYSGDHHRFGGRNFPFKRVEILTNVTPDLLEPGAGQSKLEAAPGDTIFGGAGKDEIVPRMAFWPMIPGAGSGPASDFRFQIRATDLDDRQVTFSVPLLFVGEVANDKKDDEIRRAYNASSAIRRKADLGGASVTYAPHNPGEQGDPRLPTAEMTFAAGDLKLGLHFDLSPNFYPETESAWVGIRPVQKLLAQPNAVVQVAYPTVYRDHGFGEKDPSKNKGRLFLQLINAVHPLEFGEEPGKAKSDALGALASPQMAIQGLSSLMGPVAAQVPANLSDPAQIENALSKVIGNQFDPTDFFKGAKILGGVELADILEVASSLLGADVPKLVSQDFPDRIETRFDWESEIKKSDPLGLLIPNADTGKAPTKLAMRGLVTAPLQNPQNTTLEAAAQLNNFKVNLFGFVIIWFEDLRFSARNGQKPDVMVDLRQGDDAVQFGGPLEFVNQLRNLIPSNGFSDPPELAVTPSGIAASFSLNLPTVGVGVLTLSNASLGAGFNLPFDSRPAGVNFNFSRREQPFSLTVSLLGGGGFFLIGISTRGVTEIEAALEFGAAVAINLGVASGGVEIKAGIYFHWLEPVPDQGSVELAGYVRLHGELSVLGLISASLTFNLQLAYLKENGGSTVWGMATLVVEVEVLFFSAGVSVKCRREFAGSESDPKFIDLIPNADVWAEYCEAFAEEAA